MKNGTKRFAAGIMCTALLAGVPAGANAQTSMSSESDVNIEAEALVVDITVPGTASFAFKADGSTVVPENFTITNNNKIATFYLNEASLDAGESGWMVAAEDQSLTADEKTIRISMGKEGSEKLITPENGSKDTTGKAVYADTDFLLAPSGSETMSFEIERPVFTEKIDNAKAFGMSLNFEMK